MKKKSVSKKKGSVLGGAQSPKLWVLSFQTHIKGTVRDQPEEPREMPANLIKASKLWKQAGGREPKTKGKPVEMLRLTASALRCYFVPGNIMTGAEDIAETNDVVCTKVTVSAADFSEGVVPWVKASAWFSITFKKPIVSTADLSEWQERNDLLDNGVSFQFDGRRGDYVGALTEHDGVQLELMSSKLITK